MASFVNENFEIQLIRYSENKQFSKLREYQWTGAKFLLDRQAALLADEMGLGKTVQTAVAIDLSVKFRNAKRILVICPSSLCLNWKRELSIWAPNISVRRIRGNANDRKAHFRLPFKVWIASYEQIRADIDLLRHEGKYCLVILDEAQKIKSPDASISLACRQIPRTSAWALSGTPIENKPADLLSIYAFLTPGLLHSAMNLPEIHQRIAPYFLRRKKKEVLEELPPIIYQDLILELEGPQHLAYEKEWSNGRERMRKSKGTFKSADLLSQITRLKLLCNFEPSSGLSCKLDALRNCIDSTVENNEKIIVFSQYVDTLKRIARTLKGVKVDIIHGELSAEDRNRIVDCFQRLSGPRILLLSLKVGGVGLNLGTASTVILFDRWWNPAIEDQAIQRAHRFGRETPLQVIKFIVSDTIEERIQRIIEGKRIIFEEYIDEAETAEITPFNQNDLIRIIGFGNLNYL